jgi:hypothetical protein
MRAWAFAVFALIASGCGSSTSSEAPAESHAPLIGGRISTEAEYPSTVFFPSVCTATKVGPRHFLTAGHCVLESNTSLGLRAQFRPGGKIGLTNYNFGQHTRTVTVAQTSLVGPYEYNCPSDSPPCVWGPDAALVRINEDSEDVPLAVIDGNQVFAGDRVVKTGYGCTGENTETGTLKLQEVSVPNVPTPPMWVRYVHTLKLSDEPGGASLCFGDSGGPLYRESASEQLVVGINSGFGDYHTRVDVNAPDDVSGQLIAAGARLRKPTSATAFTGAPPLVNRGLEAENFDLGDPGVSYYDITPQNQGGAYREGAVDIYAGSNAGNGHFVHAEAGEWLRYTVSAPVAGDYNLQLRVMGAPASDALRAELDSQISAPVATPATFSTPGWHTLVVPKLTLSPGRNDLRLLVDAPLDIDSFIFVALPAPTCDDGYLNGTETAVDCGGHLCSPCPAGAGCAAAADCSSGYCRSATCVDTVKEVDSGENYMCSRFASGTVRCWGRNDRGQLGLASPASVGDAPGEVNPNMPPVPLSGPAQKVALGAAHGCAILQGGAVECWGANEAGQLGAGDTMDRKGSVTHPDLGGIATQISLGDQFSCALLSSGQVKCWGANDAGQLGLGSKARIGDQPDEMGANLSAASIPLYPFFVSAGSRHVCALYLGLGQAVRCWGAASQGQLGFNAGSAYGDAANELSPPAVDLGSGFEPLRIAAGGEHTCALSFGRQVKCWGSSMWGQLGYGDTMNRGRDPGDMGDALPAVDSGGVIESLDVHSHTTCVVTSGGRSKCWGMGSAYGQPTLTYGVIGDAPGEVSPALPGIDLGPNEKVGFMTTSGWSFCAGLLSEKLKCWGLNSFGELGLGDTAVRGDATANMGANLPALPVN